MSSNAPPYWLMMFGDGKTNKQGVTPCTWRQDRTFKRQNRHTWNRHKTLDRHLNADTVSSSQRVVTPDSMDTYFKVIDVAESSAE